MAKGLANFHVADWRAVGTASTTLQRRRTTLRSRSQAESTFGYGSDRRELGIRTRCLPRP